MVEGEESLESTISSFQKIILCFVIELMVRQGLERLSAASLWWEDGMGLLFCIGGCDGC